MVSLFRTKQQLEPAAPERPRLDLSGPLLTRALETLIQGTEAQGGIEFWTDALKLKSQMFEQALGQGHAGDLPLDTFKGLCAFMASVRRRIGPYLEQPAYGAMVDAIVDLLEGARDTTTTDARLAAFCSHFPQNKKHRWVRDLGVEILHGVDPERYPLMCRWVWDRKANTGVIREIWFDDEVDNITINVPDGFGTCLMLREELSQFLTDNGVFRDVIWYVDLLCAKIYADYIAAQGGVYLRADFSAPGDPMEHTRRLLGLDGVRAGNGRTRLKAISGEAFVIDDTNLLD
ncbi:MAG: hypothetical protein HKN57_11555 [Xanthomonadales bacterium]|nr:hypothetical protein [Gammaproteobacteria bacterium]MBT8052982.1 hypothetical protein [Gammaproteobacteria bacterium]NND57874.1 hypothetical protein [Xanthomonadales bacterium]NNK50754.1 hypothetical protein [Xanthomonadales bacterium]